jgi:hypothetical protein
MFDIEQFLISFLQKKAQYSIKIPKRNWSPEAREKARQRMMSVRPWEKSTGPRTEEGKAKSSQNNFKHGRRSRTMTEVNRVITEVKRGK